MSFLKFAGFAFLFVSFACTAGAADGGLAERIAAAATRFEQDLGATFERETKPKLESWANAQDAAAVQQLMELWPAKGDSNRPYVQWHLLRLDPHQAAGIQLKPAPEPAAEPADYLAACPACSDAALVQKVTDLITPPFDVVRAVVALDAPETAAYWRAQQDALATLKRELLELSKEKQDGMGQDQLAFTLLAYYFPTAKEVRAYFTAKHVKIPRQRWWANHVDQWLLKRELAGIDCLAWKPANGEAPAKRPDGTWGLRNATWKLPERLKNCRAEAMVPGGDKVTFRLNLGDDQGGGVTLNVARGAWTLMPVQPGAAGTALATGAWPSGTSVPVQFELRGRQVVVTVGGAASVATTLPRPLAVAKLALETPGITASRLRLRFLGDAPPQMFVTAAAVPAAAAAPWQAERDRQLAKAITVNFNENSAEEVATMLGRLGGAPVTLDESSQAMKDLPVTLSASGLSLSAVFTTLERLTGLHAVANADGFVLHWQP